MLNRLFASAATWTALGLAAGFYWRELTKFNDFPRTETALATAHTHALALGTLVLLAVLAAAFIVGALLIGDHRAKWSALGAGVCAGLSLLVAVIGIVQVIGSSSAGLSYGFGWGLIVNVLGSMATLAASLLLGRRRTV